MNVQYINPFVESTIETFSMMLGTTAVRRELYIRKDRTSRHELSGVIGMSGKASGTVVFGLDRGTAFEATAKLLGEMPTEVNGDVIDAVGELTNIIAGSAKSQLEELELCISLPSVISGESHSVEFPSDVTPICIPFQTDIGDVTIQVGLVEKESAVPVVTS